MFRKRRKRVRAVRPSSPAAPVSKPARPRRASPLRAYFAHHLSVLQATLAQLRQTPVSTLMTTAVIGIALAMPAGLYVILGNLQRLATGWEGAAQISVFLKQDVSASRATALAGRLRQWDGVARLQHITPTEAMKEFRETSGFGDILNELKENPLPGVLVIRPDSEHTQAAALQALLKRLQELEEVDIAQLDMEWVRRLNAIIELGQRGVVLLGVLLGLGIVLVVGNTIRLTIFNRREEIVVSKLIGATDSFIRRPFLYTGFWYGILGSALAWLLIGACIILLNGPVSRLAGLYASQFTLAGLGVVPTFALLSTGIILGYLGSWLAVGRHLREIEPT